MSRINKVRVGTWGGGTIFSIIHDGISKHPSHLAMENSGIGNDALLDLFPYGLQVCGFKYEGRVSWGIEFADRLGE